MDGLLNLTHSDLEQGSPLSKEELQRRVKKTNMMFGGSSPFLPTQNPEDIDFQKTIVQNLHEEETAETSEAKAESSQQNDPRNKVWRENDAVIDFSDNPYVDSVTGSTIRYNLGFYIHMFSLMDSGKTAVEAYEELGFDTSILGKERANSAGRHAKEKAESDVGFSVNPASFNGSIPSSEIDLEKLSTPQLIAYMTARIHYLEAMVTMLKKRK